MVLKGEKMKGFASILSSPKVSVGDLFLLKKENDRFPTTTFGNDYESKNGDDGSPNPAGRQTKQNRPSSSTLAKKGSIIQSIYSISQKKKKKGVAKA